MANSSTSTLSRLLVHLQNNDNSTEFQDIISSELETGFGVLDYDNTSSISRGW